DHVVDEVGPHRAREAEIVHLNGGRPMSQDLGAGMRGVAFQVDENVDAVLMHPLSDVAMRHRPNVEEPVEGPNEASAHFAAVIRTVAIAEDLEAPALVALEYFGDQVRRRMLVEVGRQIA